MSMNQFKALIDKKNVDLPRTRALLLEFRKIKSLKELKVHINSYLFK
jgi:hypothetical protein